MITLATLCYIVSNSRLLLLERTRPPGEKYWNAPGGKLEPGELPEQCVRREVKEETGLELMLAKKRGEMLFHDANSGKQEDWLVHVFSAMDGDFSGALAHGEEHKNSRWFPLDSIPWDGMWPSDRDFVPIVIGTDKSFKLETRYEDGKLKSSQVKVL
ncbi:8-oxo-dGTP diphosphatase [Candidatus Micrarchaeota archaeon]|nr:8-oxo-dGTP diphosphatase [Candidatus Micrarchaeota archaeon]